MNLATYLSMDQIQLAKALDVDHFTVLGIMEVLMQFTGRNYPDGAIGDPSDDLIEELLGWPESRRGQLVPAMIRFGLIDRHTCCRRHRLMVHNWKTHAPRWALKRLQRAGKPIAETCVESATKLDAITQNGHPSGGHRDDNGQTSATYPISLDPNICRSNNRSIGQSACQDSESGDRVSGGGIRAKELATSEILKALGFPMPGTLARNSPMAVKVRAVVSTLKRYVIDHITDQDVMASVVEHARQARSGRHPDAVLLHRLRADRIIPGKEAARA